MATELFADYYKWTVTSGGNTAPSPGTTETWTVSSATGAPAASTGVSQFRIVDIADSASPPEVILVTNVSGTTWSVTRGAEGGSTWAHGTNFIVVPVVTATALGTFGASNLSVISRQVVSNSTTNVITFSSIPSTYENLRLEVWGAYNAAVNAATITMGFNGDTTSGHYQYQTLTSNSTTTTSAWTGSDTSIAFVSFPGTNVIGTTSASCRINGYARTATYKNCIIDGSGWTNTGAQSVTRVNGIFVGSTSAISQITLTAGANYFLSGSVFSLYGES